MISKYPLRIGPAPKRTCEKEYKVYRTFKKYLIEDFNSKCGYCDAHHAWFAGPNFYHIDHFAPKSKFPELKTKYFNLVYCCPLCSSLKGYDWVSDKATVSVLNDKGYIDPCDKEYAKLFYRDVYGNIKFETEGVGSYIHNKLGFYLQRHKLLWNLTRLHNIIEDIKDVLENNNLDTETKTLIETYISELRNYYEGYLNLNGAGGI